MRRNKRVVVQKAKIFSNFQNKFCSGKMKAPVDKNASGNKTGIKSKAPNYEVCNKNTGKEEKVHLNIAIAQKMLRRFLVEKQMSIEQLAEALKVDAGNLERILHSSVSLNLMSEISLPLIKLYCATEWDSKRSSPS